jgi:hypothetical protein
MRSTNNMPSDIMSAKVIPSTAWTTFFFRVKNGAKQDYRGWDYTHWPFRTRNSLAPLAG